MRRFSGIVFLVVSAFCWGQAGTPVPPPVSSQDKINQHPEKLIPDKVGKDLSDVGAKDESTDDDLPAYTLQFRESKPTGGFVSWPLIQLPVRCASDGTSFFNVIDFPSSPDQPLDPFKSTVYSVSSKGAQSFSIENLPDLDRAQFLAVDADDSKVVLLVTGKRKDKDRVADSTSGTKEMSSAKYFSGDSYIAIFDRNGSYRKSVEVGVQYGPHDIALLSSGEFVVFGYDQVKSAVRVSLLDSDGGFLRDISYSDDLINLPAFKEAETADDLVRAVAGSGIGSWRLAHARGKVLLYQPGSKAPVFEIGPNGARREVPLSLPKGYRLDQFLSSSDRWIALLQEDDSSKPAKSSARDSGDSSNKVALFELNPSDGSSRYRINLGSEIPFNPYSIACEQEGRFLAYTADKDSKFILLNADIAR